MMPNTFAPRAANPLLAADPEAVPVPQVPAPVDAAGPATLEPPALDPESTYEAMVTGVSQFPNPIGPAYSFAPAGASPTNFIPRENDIKVGTYPDVQTPPMAASRGVSQPVGTQQAGASASSGPSMI